MISFGNTTYYIDFRAIDQLISGEKSHKAQEIIDVETMETFDAEGDLESKIITTSKYNKPKEVDPTRYDLIRLMLDVILSNTDQEDETLGASRVLEKMPLSYKLAFNSLIEFGIIKEKE